MMGKRLVRASIWAILGAAMGVGAGGVFGLLHGSFLGLIHGQIGLAFVYATYFGAAGACAGAITGVFAAIMDGPNPEVPGEKGRASTPTNEETGIPGRANFARGACRRDETRGGQQNASSRSFPSLTGR